MFDSIQEISEAPAAQAYIADEGFDEPVSGNANSKTCRDRMDLDSLVATLGLHLLVDLLGFLQEKYFSLYTKWA